MGVPDPQELERPLADAQGRLLLVFDMRRDEPVAFGRRFDLGIRLREAVRIVRLPHRIARARVIDDNGGRREHEIPGRVVGMHFRVDDESHRQWRQLLHRIRHLPRIHQRLSRIDQDDTLVGEHDADRRVHLARRLDVNAFLELPEIRPEILRRRDRAGEQ